MPFAPPTDSYSAEVPRRLYWLGVFGAIACLCMWAFWLVLSRSGLTTGGIGIIDLMFLRYGVALVAISPLIWKLWPRQVHWRWQLFMALTAAGVPYSVLSFAGLRIVEIAEAGIFQNGFIPVATVVFALLIDGKKPSRAALIGIAVILTGCLSLGLQGGIGQAFSHFNLGHLYLLLTAILIALYMVVAPRTGIRPLQVMVLVPTVNGIIVAVLWFFHGSNDLWLLPTETLLLQGLYQGLGPSILGVLTFFWALRYFGKTETASVMAGVPALATLMAIPFLHEYPTLWGWIGIVLVSVGILLVVRRKT